MNALPKIAYIGDVPVEASYHGSALLHRLLEKYPPERLRIVEAGFECSRPERRLPGVMYVALPHPGERLMRSRLHRWVSSLFSLGATWRKGRVSAELGDFTPQAVMTVAHGYSWITAAAYARERGIPLHLIVHDDWPRVSPDMGPIRRWVEKKFAEIYHEAFSRFCVSPYMAEEYRNRYGLDGVVLYPSRAPHVEIFDETPKCGEKSAQFVVGYAGSLATRDFIRQLSVISRALRDLSGKLRLYGPFNESSLLAAGLDMSSVECVGLVPQGAILKCLREEVDLLFLPMSFDPFDRKAMAINFPSKLTDYTACGLPILIWGPPESSAVKWARQEEGVAAIVQTDDDVLLVETLRSLARDTNRRKQLGERALSVGKKYFSPEVAENIFFTGIAR